MAFYLYKIWNTINDRYYIGRSSCTCDPKDHDYMGSGTAIKNAINKYGKSAFIKHVLCVSNDFDLICEFEEALVDDVLDDPLSYNLIRGGKGSGLHTENRLEKIRNARAKQIISSDTISKMNEAWTG